MSDERKEWVKVSHAANGLTSVSVTLQEGNATAKWAVKTYLGHIKQSVGEARGLAETALTQIREAME